MFSSCCTIVKAMLLSTYEQLSNRLPESILSMFFFLSYAISISRAFSYLTRTRLLLALGEGIGLLP